jgi:predicted transcriptional regulator
MIFTIMVSNHVGVHFTRSIYERSCRAKQLPILIDKVPEPCKKIIAEDVMARNVVTLQCVDTVTNIEEAITKTNHHGFPVLNSKGECIGLIPRNYIIVLITKNWFYQKDSENINDTILVNKKYNSNLEEKLNKNKKYRVIRE